MRVGVQALAKGLAMVVSHIGGFVDLVDDGRNGFLVKVDDQARFRQCLHKLISNPNTLMQFRKESLKKAAMFDIVRVAEQYETVLQDVVHGR